MRFDNQTQFENSIIKGINLFIGAGFSILSKNKDGKNLPIGNQLSEELKEFFSISGNFSLPQISTILENSKRDEFYNFLKKRFEIGEFDEKYKNIEKLNIKSIYTTNIDNLVYEIYKNIENRYLNDVSHNGSNPEDPSSIDYSALHGCILYQDRKLIFDVSSLNNAYTNSPRIWNHLSHSIEKLPTLFWGYSLNDTGVIQSITSNRTSKSAQKDFWIILRKEEEEISTYFESLGFNIIISDTAEFLEYLEELTLKSKKEKVDSIENEEIKIFFKKDLVPKNAFGLPVRPIANFFQGNPPSWSDIFSSQIFKTSYYKKIQNDIIAGKNSIIIGGPVTGKTTLLMQLSISQEIGDCYKLIFNHITEHKAELIKSVFKGKKTYIFLDNLSDSLDAFIKLSKVEEFTIIGCERTHNYGIISHLLDEKQFVITNITKLSDFDIQGIYDNLPIDQRKTHLQRETNSAYDKDSIFEFISRNVRYANIDDRFKKVLNELEEKDEYLVEFLILTSYVHFTRIPISFDMLYNFFRDDIDSFEEIYEMREDLRDLVKTYSGELTVTDEQDYYFPRSIFIAETILKVANKEKLKFVIENALEKIPNTAIPYYNIYRKSAFDKNLIIKAFTNWKDGKNFYEKAYKYDFYNPYVLQQGALYLAQMKKFTEAFHWIDRAITQTNNKYFSIRNSHAIILFDANINNPSDSQEIREQLDFSMTILEQCITNDKRKIFHAIRFAEQTIEYSKRYYDSKTKTYIEKAKQWLNIEQRKYNWNFELKALLKTLDTYQF